MSEVHIEEHSSPIKNWKQLLVVGVLAFVVPVLLLIAVVQLVTGGMRTESGSPDMTEELIAARIKPVGELNLATDGAAQAPADMSKNKSQTAGRRMPLVWPCVRPSPPCVEICGIAWRIFGTPHPRPSSYPTAGSTSSP